MKDPQIHPSFMYVDNGGEFIPLTLALEPSLLTPALSTNAIVYGEDVNIANQLRPIKLDLDNADNQTPNNSVMIALSRLQGLNGSGNWDRLRILSATNQALVTDARGVITAAKNGHWSQSHTPGVNQIATTTRAAPGVGFRHVITSITITVSGPAASNNVLFHLFDGGAFVWSARLQSVAGGSAQIALSDLSIVLGDNNAANLSCTGVPGGTEFTTVAMTGYTQGG